MCNPVQLRLDCLCNQGMLVAMEIRPDGGVCVEVLSTGYIVQHGPLPRLNNDRILSQPLLHLGKWMPEIAVVRVGERELHKLIGIVGCRLSCEPPKP